MRLSDERLFVSDTRSWTRASILMTNDFLPLEGDWCGYFHDKIRRRLKGSTDGIGGADFSNPRLAGMVGTSDKRTGNNGAERE